MFPDLDPSEAQAKLAEERAHSDATRDALERYSPFRTSPDGQAEEWKEVLLVLLGAFVASFSKLIDFWFNNQEAENALLEASQDVNGK